jgi:hypothetical protein
MNHPLVAMVAAAIALLVGSSQLRAEELQFNVPETARAQKCTELLSRTARALYKAQAQTPRANHAEKISSLWLFPTADADTVFAHYRLSSAEGAPSSTEHLVLVTVSGDRITAFRELTGAEVAPGQDRPISAAHRSAAIGNEHSSRSQPAHAH